MRALLLLPGSALAWLLLVNHGSLGYDPAWSLVWGHEIVSGHLPQLDATTIAPTPHPLANAVAALAALLGGDAPDALLWLSAVAIAGLVLAAYELGAAVAGPLTGAVLALLIATRPLLAGEGAQASIDIPFLALVIWAAALATRDPRQHVRVFVLLALAGLLRPEVWLLAVVYAVYLGWRGNLRTRARLAVWALVAPVLWTIADVVATGDPSFSLHGTQDLATFLGRPRAAGTALHLTTPYLRFILGGRIMWLGFAGAVAGAILLYRRVVVPSLLLWLGLLAFVGLGVAHLPVLIRYLLMPAAMLALFAALTVGGWTRLPAASRERRAWIAAAVVAAVVLLSGASSDRDQLRVVDGGLMSLHTEAQDLRSLLRQPGVARLSRRCPQLDVDGFRYVPLAGYLLKRDPRSVHLTPRPGGPSPLTLTRVGDPAPTGFRRAAGNAGWTLYERCSRTPPPTSSS